MLRFQKYPQQHGPLHFTGDVNEMLQMRQGGRSVVLTASPGLATFLTGNRRHLAGLDVVQFNCCHTRLSLRNNVRDCANS